MYLMCEKMSSSFLFFFFNDTATTDIYTLSLHDALPISGAVPRFVPIRLEPGFPFDPDQVRAAVTPKTRAIVVNTPHNPTGKVFTRPELEFIAELCHRHDLLAITDEVYEHIIYDGQAHTTLAALPGMLERTVIVNS